MFNNVKLLNKSMNRNIDYITINSNSVEPYIKYSISDDCYHSLEIVKKKTTSK